MKMTAMQAEKSAHLVWDAVINLMSSEVAAQETMAQTPKDFENYAVTYLVETLMTGRVRPLSKKIDATTGPVGEDLTGNYHFEAPGNLEAMTYSQAIMGLAQQVPQEYRLKFKQLHAGGASPWEAYRRVLDDWEKAKRAMGDG